jgi:excisionase family DNA binding protein
MPEKLITIKEVAEYLHLSEEEVKRLVDMGVIPAYKIGGSFLRFRKEQIDAIKSEIDSIEAQEPEHAEPVFDTEGHPTHPYTDMEKEIKRRQPITRQYDYTFAEKIRDFFYFNDFYIFSFIIIGILIFLIFRT